MEGRRGASERQDQLNGKGFGEPMDKWVCLVESNPEPAREAAYNDWCERVHISDVLGTPGFVAAQRYQSKEMRDGRGKYLVIYEIESDDIQKTMALRAERLSRERREGRALDPVIGFDLWRDVLWKQIFQARTKHRWPSAQKWVNFVEQFSDPARQDEYHDWYNNIHIPDILETPDFHSAKRYYREGVRDGRGEYLAIYDIESDDIERTMKIRLEKRLEEQKLGRSSASRANLTRPLWRDVLWRQISEHRPSA